VAKLKWVVREWVKWKFGLLKRTELLMFLQEMLTIKSDDVHGRAKAFEAIVKGEDIPTPTVPEAFRVLCKELNSLSLNIVALDPTEEEVEEKLPALIKKRC
jgi:hypothetical protein